MHWRLGFRPRPGWGAYSAPQTLQPDFEEGEERQGLREGREIGRGGGN